mgnify:CR=1 FL=1
MMDYNRQSGVDTRIVRIFNTYGERMLENDGRVVSNFIVQALRNEPILVYGDGQQSRCFSAVSGRAFDRSDSGAAQTLSTPSRGAIQEGKLAGRPGMRTHSVWAVLAYRSEVRTVGRWIRSEA